MHLGISNNAKPKLLLTSMVCTYLLLILAK